jgi:hypothetical protein
VFLLRSTSKAHFGCRFLIFRLQPVILCALRAGKTLDDTSRPFHLLHLSPPPRTFNVFLALSHLLRLIPLRTCRTTFIINGFEHFDRLNTVKQTRPKCPHPTPSSLLHRSNDSLIRFYVIKSQISDFFHLIR